jgi:hypothetical protein
MRFPGSRSEMRDRSRQCSMSAHSPNKRETPGNGKQGLTHAAATSAKDDAILSLIRGALFRACLHRTPSTVATMLSSLF